LPPWRELDVGQSIHADADVLAIELNQLIDAVGRQCSIEPAAESIVSYRAKEGSGGQVRMTCTLRVLGNALLAARMQRHMTQFLPLP